MLRTFGQPLAMLRYVALKCCDRLAGAALDFTSLFFLEHH